jgi:regulation of enolase protein 1 (concanavalin A-like superfamily)
VVTNHGYSDWSTQPVPADQRIMWYRLSRRVSDFRVDWSTDGQAFHQLRLFHLAGADAQIQYGLLACSPTDGPFRAVFSQPRLTECLWEAE